MSGTAKPNRKLLEHQAKTAEYVRTDWIVMPEAGTTLTEMEDSAYWANVAKKMRPFDRIEVRFADGRLWAELLVTVVEPFSVMVHTLRKVELAARLSEADFAVPAGYDVMNRGRAGWAVVRLSDKMVLREGEKTREAAILWLRSHLMHLGKMPTAA